MLIAGRSWDQLDFGRWSEIRGGAVKPDSVASNAVDRRNSFVLDAETSAALVLALVRSVHTGHGPTGSPVGPGWRVWDAPDATDAVFGGKFDDSGFRAARKALADGRRRVGRIDGDGHSRRPSFRDLPRDLPSHLIVDPPDRVETPEALRVDALSIHPLPDGRWVLDLGGLFVTTHPDEMLNCCVAGVGANRSSYRGVETPALLFEGLEIRA
jgi:hypothetical protein